MITFANRLLVCISATALLFSQPLLADHHKADKEKEKEISMAVTEVSKGIFMIKGVGGFTGGNIGLSIGDDGVVMIDDSMPPMLDMLKNAVQKVTKQPVDFLINTHIHGDHTGNNASFGKGDTRIVAHENLRKRMLQKEGDDKVAPSALPVITFSEEINFYLNGDEAHVFHAPHAHTDGDAIIHFKKANVIHAGDTFFHGMFPFIDLDNGGSVDGFIAAQKLILSHADSVTKIIPGHGDLTDRDGLQRDLAMLEDARSIVADLVKKGKSEEEVVEMNPLKKYHDSWNWGFITTEKMTRQLYKSLSKGKTASHSH